VMVFEVVMEGDEVRALRVRSGESDLEAQLPASGRIEDGKLQR
jgi:hypothetical protein